MKKERSKVLCLSFLILVGFISNIEEETHLLGDRKNVVWHQEYMCGKGLCIPINNNFSG